MAVLSNADIQTFFGVSSLSALQSQLAQFAEQHVKDHLGWQEINQADIPGGSWVEYYPTQQQDVLMPGEPLYTADSAYKRAIPLQFQPSPVLQLRNLPVRSVSQVLFDPTGFYGQVTGSFDPTKTALVAGTDYYLRTEQSGISWSGQLVRRTYWWPGAEGSLQVTYVSGFTAAELSGRWSVFKTACLETLAHLWLRAKAIGLGQFPDIKSETDGGGVSASYELGNLSGLPVPDRVAEMLGPYIPYGDGWSL